MAWARLRQFLDQEEIVKKQVVLWVGTGHLLGQVERAYIEQQKKYYELSGWTAPSATDSKLVPTLTQSTNVKRYNRAVEVIFVYCAIKYTFLDWLKEAIERLFEPRLPGECYLFGRFVMVDEFRRPFAAYLAWINLLWRASRLWGQLHISTFRFLFVPHKQLVLQLNGLSNGNKPALVETPRSPAQRRIDDLLFLKTHNGSLSLRPNRGLATLMRLRSIVTNVSLLFLLIFVILTLTIGTCHWVVIPNDRDYLDRYQGCNPELAQQAASGELPTWSVWPERSWHRWLSVAFDGLENWCLWAETGFTLMGALAPCVLIHFDLLEYWHYLDLKARKMACRIVFDNLQAQHCDAVGRNDHPTKLASCGRTKSRHSQATSGDDKLVKYIRRRQGRELDLFSRQALDFFEQLANGDLYVSDAITLVLSSWICFLNVSVYFLIVNNTLGDYSLAKISLQLTTLGFLSVLLGVLLELHRNSFKTYQVVCSLMATSWSPKKSNLKLVLNHFIDNRVSYTLFGLKPITTTTALSLIGWSISCFFILSNLILLQPQQ